jgi:hypothetical protein
LILYEDCIRSTASVLFAPAYSAGTIHQVIMGVPAPAMGRPYPLSSLSFLRKKNWLFMRVYGHLSAKRM